MNGGKLLYMYITYQLWCKDGVYVLKCKENYIFVKKNVEDLQSRSQKATIPESTNIALENTHTHTHKYTQKTMTE